MAGIPTEFINQVLDRIDIIDVIAPRVSLKKAGKDYQALCPFHTENTPSFTVSQHKQFYHCFGCGKHGSAIRFLMDFEGMEFVDAVETLAQSTGLAIPKTSFQQNNKSKNLYELTSRANRFFSYHFKQSEVAKRYMTQRKISHEVLELFQIGYAPDLWDGLLKNFPHQEINNLFEAGLVTKNDHGKVYDKFRNRVIFPISDKRGRVIAFGGRAITQDQKPKYLNSPETPLFHKSKELYGYNLARKYGDSKQIIVVEGYMDVIALHQAGVKNAVATLGTATSSQHIITLLRAYDEIIFCFDGDTAGREAAWKALVTSLPNYRDDKSIRFLFLPQSHDPDTYIQEFGTENFKQQVDNATTLSVFLIETISQDIDLTSIDGRAKFIENSKQYVNQLPKGEFKKLLIAEINNLSKSQTDFNHSTEVKIQPVQQWNPVRKAIAILLNSPHLVEKIPETTDLALLNQNGTKILTDIIDFCRSNPHITTAGIIEGFQQHKASQHLSQLAAIPLDLNSDQLIFELDDILSYFAKTIEKNEIETLRRKQSESGLTQNEQQRLVELLTKQINKN